MIGALLRTGERCYTRAIGLTGGLAITTLCLAAEELQEQSHGFPLIVEGVLNHTTARSDPSPAAGQAFLAEQSLIDRHGVEPRQTPARVLVFYVEVILLRNHADRIAHAASDVQ